MGSFLFRNAVLCGLLAWPVSGFQRSASLDFLRTAQPQAENAKLLRVEALAENDSAYAAGLVPGLETVSGTRLEVLGRRLMIKRKLGLNFSPELYQLDLWYGKKRGLDSLYRTNSRDLAYYALAMASLGRNTDNVINELGLAQNGDGSWSDKKGKLGSPGLTVLAVLAIRNAPATPDREARVKRALQWVVPSLGGRLTTSRSDLLFLLKAEQVLASESAYRNEFDAVWTHIERQQGSNGSIQNDVEITAMAALVNTVLPGNLELREIPLVDVSGRKQTEALINQTISLQPVFRARNSDFSGQIRVRLSLQPNGSTSPRILDTVIAAAIVKGAEKDFRLSLGNADSVGYYRVEGTFAYLVSGDSVKTSIPQFFFRVDAVPDLSFAGDSLKVSPDTSKLGDTVAIRVQFTNTGKSIAKDFRLVCLVKPIGGSFDTLGIQIFPRAAIGQTISFTFLSSFAAGNYQTRIVLDGANDVSESNEGNNSLDRNFSVVSLPDLAFKGSLDVACTTVGDSAQCQAKATLINKGTAASDSFKVRLTVHAGAVQQRLQDSLQAGLASAAQRNITVNFTLPDSLAASIPSYLVAIVLDPADSIREADEGNNRSEKTMEFSTGKNYTVKENAEAPAPIFIVPKISVTEHFDILARHVQAADSLLARVTIRRDSLDTVFRLDTILVFTQGNSARPLAVSWTPTDSAQAFLVSVRLDPANSISESVETDNLLTIKRIVTGFNTRLLAGPARIDSTGQMSIRIQVKDYLGKPVAGLDKGAFALLKAGATNPIGSVQAVQSGHLSENRIDVVIMDTHEPASLYRTRIQYYDLMPELQNEFARVGYSLNFAFRTPFFKERTDEGTVRGDFAQGIFNGEVRNLLDEPDHTYKWAPAATYLATTYPWRPNALKVIVPMFSHLGQGEEFNSDDPVVPNQDDTSHYHLEFADTCFNRGIIPYLMVSDWGYNELRIGQTKAIVAKTGGSVAFPKIKERMKAELRQFIADQIANYELKIGVKSLGFTVADGDPVKVQLQYRQGSASDSAFIVQKKALELDVRTTVSGYEIRNDSLVVSLFLENRSDAFVSGLMTRITQKKNGGTLSDYSVPQGYLEGNATKMVTLAVPLTMDSVNFVFKSFGNYRDVVPGNDQDSVLALCARCPYADLSLYADTLQDIQISEKSSPLTQFRLLWHDKVGGQIRIDISDAAANPIYRAEMSSTAGFNSTFITLATADPLAGSNVDIAIDYLEKADRNRQDNAKAYPITAPNNKVFAFFKSIPSVLRTGAIAETTTVELSNGTSRTFDTSMTILARNRADSSLVSLVRTATSTHIDSGTESGREAYVNLTLSDSLTGSRYGEYVFLNQTMSSAFHLPAGSEVNRASFKLVQLSGPHPGKVYPLNVTAFRSGNTLLGYKVQWPIHESHFSGSNTHRLYFSFDDRKKFADGKFVGDDIYTLNNFGDLRYLHSYQWDMVGPVFKQKFTGTDSLRYMRLGIGDMNEDGYDDLIYTDKNRLLIRHGDSTGSFGSPDTIKSTWRTWEGFNEVPYDAAGISEPKIGDFNGDGHLDIAVCPIGFSENELLLGNGSESYANQFWGWGWISMGSPGDVFRPAGQSKDFIAQSDGSTLDAWRYPYGSMSVDTVTNSILYYGYGGQGGFLPQGNSPSGGAVVVDIDNDGKEDMLSDYFYTKWNFDPLNTRDDFTARFEVPPTVAYWRGTGGAAFTPQLQAADENKVYGLIPSIHGWSEIASMDNTDFNGDGYADMVLTEGSAPFRTLLYEGKGDFTFGAPTVLGYDTVGVWGMQVAYHRTIKATASAPVLNRPSGNVVSVIWNPASVGPGEFNLEAWVHGSGADSTRIGTSPTFRILPALNLTVTVKPDKPAFQAGSAFSGTVELANADSLHPASELKASAYAVATGDTVQLFRDSTLSIGASASLSFPVRFTAKASQSIRVYVEQAGKTDTTLYTVPVISNQALVKGTLGLGNYEGVEVFRTGRNLTFASTAANSGNGSAATHLILLLQKLGTSTVDTLRNESLTLSAGSTISRSDSRTIDSAGSYRAVLLRAGPVDTVALDSKLIRINGSLAPQIVKTIPKAGSLVSAGTLMDIWVDTLQSLSQVTVTQNTTNRTALFRKDSLGYKIYRDTIKTFSGTLLPVSISAQDGSGHNNTTAADDANPLSFTYLFSATPQPFTVSGVQNGVTYGSDRLVSVRADPGSIRFPSILLDGHAWTSGTVSTEGNHSLVLTGILMDGRAYSQTLQFSLDKTGPQIECDNISEGDVLDYEVIPVVRVFDSHVPSMAVYLDGNAWNGGVVGSGTHALLANAKDSLGNQSTLALSFTVRTQTGKYAKLNPPTHGSYHNRTVYPGIESNLDDILNTRIGRRNSATFDSTSWSGIRDSIRSDTIRSWISAFGRGDGWSHVTDTSFFGFGPNGHFYNAGVKTDSLASWASESISRNRSADTAFPESVLVVSTDSGLYLFDSNRKSFWLRFQIDYSSNNNSPIHRPLYNVQYMDGWLFGFWDSGFLAVSFQNDLMFGWNTGRISTFYNRWSGISGRNSGVTPATGFAQVVRPAFTNMHRIYASALRSTRSQIATMSADSFTVTITVRPGITPVLNSGATTLPHFATGMSNGMGYRLSSAFVSNPENSLDTLGKGSLSTFGYTNIANTRFQYGVLSPDLDFKKLIKSFGHRANSSRMHSLSFLTNDYLQTTYFNYIDTAHSLQKRVIKVGSAPILPLTESGLFNSQAWRVDSGLVQVRHGMIQTDTTNPSSAENRLVITEKQEHVSDFIADYTIVDNDPARANTYLRIAFKDSTGQEIMTTYIGCDALSQRFFASHFNNIPRMITQGYKDSSTSERATEIYTLPQKGVIDYQIRLVKTGGNYHIFFWDADKWTQTSINPSSLASTHIVKRPLHMEFSIHCSSGNPTMAFRLDSFREANTYYMPATVQRLEDAVPFGDRILFRTHQLDSTIRYFAFDTASKAIEPASEAFTESATRRILCLTPGTLLTQVGSQVAIRKNLGADDIFPLDSVASEGTQELLSRVTSAKYGVFRDTSVFIIDKTRPNITITGVAQGTLYNSAVTITYTATDSHLDTSRTEATLNGLKPLSLTVSQNGSYAFRVKAVDSAGNVADTAISFSIAPNFRLTGAATQILMNEDVPDSSLSVVSLFNPSSGPTYSVIGAPDLAAAITSSSKLFLQPAANFSGIRDVVVQATLSGVTLKDTLRIVVRPVNDPPHLVSADTIFGVGGTPVSYQIQVGDPDDIPTYQTTGLPGFLTRSGSLISGMAPFYGSSTQFTLAMSDGDTTINKTIYVRITNMNTPPTISPVIEVEPYAGGDTIHLNLASYIHDAEEPGSNLTWSWGTSSHVTATQGANKDLWNLAPTSGFHDTVTLRVTLTDPGSATAYQDVFLDWTLDNGPIHTYLKSWYPFRERTGTSTKDSLSSATFTLTSSSMWSADTGLTYKTVSTASSGTNLTLDPTKGLAFEFWLKADSLRTDTLNILTFTRTTSPTTPAWSIRLLNKELRVYQSNTTSNSTASFSNAVSRENAWHHFVVSIESDSVALYRNGLRFGKVGNPGLNSASVSVTPALGGAGSVGGNPAEIALLRIYQNKSSAFKALHNFGKTEKQEALAYFFEAEHFNSRVGSNFPYHTITTLPSDTALATDDTTELCILNPSDSSYVKFTVSVSQTGTYYLFGRALGKVYDNSFWVQVDNGSSVSWHTSFGNLWKTDWLKGPVATTPTAISLSAGTHNIRIYTRERGTLLDWIGLSSGNDLLLPFVENPIYFPAP